MPVIRWDDVDAYVEARDRVVQAAMDLVDRWDLFGHVPSTQMSSHGHALRLAVSALRSLYADRGLRDPGPPGEQEPDAEQGNGEAVHRGSQS